MDTILSLTRHLITFGGGFLVAKGYINADDLNSGTGAIVTLVSLAWMGFAKSPKFPGIK